MVIVISVDIVVSVLLYEDVVEREYLFSYNKESTPGWWMGVVASNVWTCASARRWRRVNRRARGLTRTDDGRSRRANGRDDDGTRRGVDVFFFSFGGGGGVFV